MRTVQISIVSIVAIVGATLGAILFVALWPYLQVVGRVATGFIIVVFACAGVLVMFGTYNLIGIMGARRQSAILKSRIISEGDVVAAWSMDGTFIHLSAQHEAAKVPLQIEAAKPEPPHADREDILEVYRLGNSVKDIAAKFHETEYRVRQIINQAGEMRTK